MSFVVCLKPLRHKKKLFWENVKQQIQYRNLNTNLPSASSICNLKSIQPHHRCHFSRTQVNFCSQNYVQNQLKLFDFHNEWPANEQKELLQDMILIEDIVSEAEEEKLYAEIQKAMKRMRYQYDHWDNAIHGFREMEKLDWWPENDRVFQRVRNKAFVGDVLPHVHILDLAADGIIKPHVDSSRYCGSTIAGISLLTDCIMRLKRVDETKYKQNSFIEDTKVSNRPEDEREKYKRDESPTSESNEDNKAGEFNFYVDILLKRRSLYIMKDSARYKFSHEVLASKSKFLGKEIVKDRRISIICRNQP